MSRDHFLYHWLLSRRPLRFWLVTALKHHLFEQLADKARQERGRRVRPAKEKREDGPEAAYHREVALSVVREAVRVRWRGEPGGGRIRLPCPRSSVG